MNLKWAGIYDWIGKFRVIFVQQGEKCSVQFCVQNNMETIFYATKDSVGTYEWNIHVSSFNKSLWQLQLQLVKDEKFVSAVYFYFAIINFKLQSQSADFHQIVRRWVKFVRKMITAMPMTLISKSL